MKTIKELRERGISLAEANEQDEARKAGQKDKGVQKRAVLVKAGDAEGMTEGSPMPPNEEQLAKINQFTRRSVTADEVVAFKTYSCNDMPDRDDDQFTAQCVKGFYDLEGPFSSVGKSYMIGHDYSKNAVGRIFDVGMEKINGVNFLTNHVYIPNTDANKSFIENIDFGVNWAVSVGVMLDSSECSVCGAGFSSYGWWCAAGHDKGAYYDPKSEEVDSWGYPMPVNSDTKGAVKCIRQFTSPKDFYELSQVFLGAQYDAQIGKGIAKAASALKVPILGLSTEEAKGIDVVHEPEEVSLARSIYNVKTTDDGVIKWKDQDNLVWTFDTKSPNDGIMSLGKSSETDQEEENAGNRTGADSQERSASDDGNDGSFGEGSKQSGQDQAGDSEDGGEDLGVQGPDSVEVTDSPDDKEIGDEEEMDKAAVLKAAATAKIPTSIIEKATEAEGNGFAVLLTAAAETIESLAKEVEKSAPKVALGESYIKSLRTDAIDWYVKSHATAEGESVKIDNLTKMLDAFGDDVDLIKTVIEENKALAQAKFPQAVRRSSFPTDPNAKDAPTGLSLEEQPTADFANKIHR